MLEIALGSALIYYFATEAFEIEKKPPGTVYYTETALLHKDLKVKTSHIYSNLSDNSGMWSA